MYREKMIVCQPWPQICHRWVMKIMSFLVHEKHHFCCCMETEEKSLTKMLYHNFSKFNFWELWSHTCVFSWSVMLGACRFYQFSSNALYCLQTNKLILQSSFYKKPVSKRFITYFKTNGIITMKKHVKVQYLHLA
jgi:hypothetical protein